MRVKRLLPYASDPLNPYRDAISEGNVWGTGSRICPGPPVFMETQDSYQGLRSISGSESKAHLTSLSIMEKADCELVFISTCDLGVSRIALRPVYKMLSRHLCGV